jgi:hypothetical protein
MRNQEMPEERIQDSWYQKAKRFVKSTCKKAARLIPVSVIGLSGCAGYMGARINSINPQSEQVTRYENVPEVEAVYGSAVNSSTNVEVSLAYSESSADNIDSNNIRLGGRLKASLLSNSSSRNWDLELITGAGITHYEDTVQGPTTTMQSFGDDSYFEVGAQASLNLGSWTLTAGGAYVLTPNNSNSEQQSKLSVGVEYRPGFKPRSKSP